MRTAWQRPAMAIGLALALTPAAAKAPGDGITLTGHAWSSSPTRWTVHPDGSIDDDRGVNAAGLALPIPMVGHHAPPAPGRYAAIERLLAPAKRLAGRRIACDLSHSDDLYGRVTWPDGTRLDYGFGCEGAANRPIVDGVRAATARVSAWIADAPVTRHYQITTPEEYNRP